MVINKATGAFLTADEGAATPFPTHIHSAKGFTRREKGRPCRRGPTVR